jgi:uncharacterized protein involved in outer membrane biogenesis
LVLLLVLVGLFALAALALPLIVDADSLKAAAESRVSQALGRPVTVAEISFSIWTGPAIRANGLEVGGPEGDEAPITLRVDRVNVRPAILPLLRKELEIRSARLQGGVLRQGDRVLADDLDLRGRVSLRDGGLTLDQLVLDAEELRFEVSGTASAPTDSDSAIRFDLATPMLDLDALVGLAAAMSTAPPGERGQPAPPGSRSYGDLHARGTLRAERGLIQGIEVGDISIEVVMEGGVLTLDPVRYEISEGRGEGRIEIDLDDPALPFSVANRSDDLAPGVLLASVDPSWSETIAGVGLVDLRATGSAGAADPARSLRGTARLEVRDGMLAGIDLVREVGRVFELAGLGGVEGDRTEFDDLSGTFDIGAGKAVTKDLRLRSTLVDLDGNGDLDLNGSLDLALLATFSPELSEALIGKVAQLEYRKGKDGRVSIPLRVVGNMTEPRVEIDLDRILRDGIQDRIKKRGKGLLRDLFGERED